MRIKSLSITNFRCIKSTKLFLEPYTSFVGPNNAGKSTMLNALALLLNPRANVGASDVCSSRSSGNVELVGALEDLSDKELEVYSRFILRNDSISLRVLAEIDEAGNLGDTVHAIAMPHWTNHWFLNPDADGRLSNAEKVSNEHDQSTDPELTIFLAENLKKGRSKAEIHDFQQRWLNSHDSIPENPELTWHDFPKSGPIIDHLPEIQFMPAELTIDDDASLKTGSLFHRLVKMLTLNMETQFHSVQTVLNGAIESLLEGEGAHIRKHYETAISDELLEWDTEATIVITPPDAKGILEKSFELILNDGTESAADRKGHGLQRATFFALTRAIAKLQQDAGNILSQHRSLILLVEEPELYLHPQAQRRLEQSLGSLANSSNTQVILATHSPQFVNFGKAHEIRRMTKNSAGQRYVHSIQKQVLETLLPDKQKHNMDYWLNPHRNEMFFADLVLVVEGQTESAIIPTICELLGEDTTTLSTIDANGKGNLLPFIKVLNAFNIPYLVVHDEDPIMKEEGNYSNGEDFRRDKETYKLNQVIAEHIEPSLGLQYIVCPEFEPMFGVSNSSAKKLGKGLAAQKRLEKYLEATPLELPEEIHQILESLRRVKSLSHTANPHSGIAASAS